MTAIIYRYGMSAPVADVIAEFEGVKQKIRGMKAVGRSHVRYDILHHAHRELYGCPYCVDWYTAGLLGEKDTRRLDDCIARCHELYKRGLALMTEDLNLGGSLYRYKVVVDYLQRKSHIAWLPLE